MLQFALVVMLDGTAYLTRTVTTGRGVVVGRGGVDVVQ